VIPVDLCARCKGRKRLCGIPNCPILERFKCSLEVRSKIKSYEVQGATPPSAIVGERGYPYVRILYGLPPGATELEARRYEDPKGWWGVLSLDDVVRLRSSMLYSIIRAKATSPLKLYEEEIPLAAVSERPVDSEAKLAKIPEPRLTFYARLMPIGPTAPVRRIKVVDNPKVPRKLEEIMWDSLHAKDAVVELYRGGVDVYTIQRALAFGLLGFMHKRRLVPSRWAITAIDTILGDYLLEKVRDRPWIDQMYAGYVEYLSNRFLVILKPGSWRATWIEVWHPAVFLSSREGPVVIVNREGWRGRESLDGGYEAARMAILEYLHSIGRQAEVVIIREVDPSYYVGVGNWHIRESLRRITARLRKFNTVDEILQEYCGKFRVGLREVLGNALRGRNAKIDEYA